MSYMFNEKAGLVSENGENTMAQGARFVDGDPRRPTANFEESAMTAPAELIDTSLTVRKPDLRGSVRPHVRELIRFAIVPCSLGHVLVAISAHGIIAVFLGADADELRDDLAHRFPAATLEEGGAGLETITAQVVAFVESPAQELKVPLDIRGTAFQQSVWGMLRKIPAGATASYTDIAQRIGHPKAIRAVAHACAANPLAIVVPCHRVVRSDGGLSGYRWGVQRKLALLEREGVAS